MSRPRRPVALAGLALAPLLLVGCTHAAAPTTTTAPAATEATTSATPFQIMCTPVVGDPSPKPCTQADYDKLRQQRMDYADAEKVYRAFYELDRELVKSGGTATPDVRLLLAGPMVDQYEQDKKRQHDAKVTSVGDGTLVFVRPSAEEPYSGSDLALDTCVDGSRANVYADGVAKGSGATIQVTASMKKVGGQFKVWWRQGKVVSSC